MAFTTITGCLASINIQRLHKKIKVLPKKFYLSVFSTQFLATATDLSCPNQSMTNHQPQSRNVKLNPASHFQQPILYLQITTPHSKYDVVLNSTPPNIQHSDATFTKHVGVTLPFLCSILHPSLQLYKPEINTSKGPSCLRWKHSEDTQHLLLCCPTFFPQSRAHFITLLDLWSFSTELTGFVSTARAP